MTSTKKIQRNADVQFTWMTRDLGPQYLIWQEYATAWLTTQTQGLPTRIWAIQCFVENYLHKQKLPFEPEKILHRNSILPSFFDVACPQSTGGISYNNIAAQFLDWVLEAHFSESDDHGRPVVSPDFYNPITPRSKKGMGRRTESVHSPLPYRFIRELRDILAPGAHFQDWTWAQSALGSDVVKSMKLSHGGDWFPVKESLIDVSDPDCVWRRRPHKDGYEILEMWSPVRSLALLVKLMLPLRTFQVRMLDSGEADTWRYTQQGWVKNDNALAAGNEKKSLNRGVFRRVLDLEKGEERTSLFINTNKTADIDRAGDALGYTIPWQYNELLYWLEKLRNWQTKYNPITKPTAWSELGIKQLKHIKSDQQLAAMPDTCFLFRDPAARKVKEKALPIGDGNLANLWHRLLLQLEDRCKTKSELSKGMTLKFVVPDTEAATYYPLHSLRVSLLTCLALDAEVPLVVLSKLVAGHSRLVMTLYYTKIGVTHMTHVLDAATRRLNEGEGDGLQRFLQEAEYESLLKNIVANSTEGVRATIPIRTEERQPAGWMSMHHGLCLVGGNTSPVEGNTRVGGCFNGGERLRENKHDPSMNTNAPVPGGVRNCVRCRWFITEPHYLDALRAHFNTTSYHVSEAAKLAHSYEETLEALKKRRYEAEQQQLYFSEESTYLKYERLWEAELARADQLANDLIATYRLIKRCFDLIEERDGNEDKQLLVAVGNMQDLSLALEDTPSELLQLSGVCQDAELYPDELPGKAIIRLSQFLDSALYREGIEPVFMALHESEQLRLANRLLKHLSCVAQPQDPFVGMRKVIGVIESGRRLADIGVETDLVDLLEAELVRPVARLADLTLSKKTLSKVSQLS